MEKIESNENADGRPKKFISLPLSDSTLPTVHIELPMAYTPMDSETTESSNSATCRELAGGYAILERHLSLMERLGLDLAVNSKRKRRLATYYTLGMLVNMQVESGGTAWCLDRVPEMQDSEFQRRIKSLESFVANEAEEAIEELADRLKRMNKYRIIHSGSETDELVTVQQWLRAVLLYLLETPVETPAAVGMLVRKPNTWMSFGKAKEEEEEEDSESKIETV
eukprot:IDg13720t1